MDQRRSARLQEKVVNVVKAKKKKTQKDYSKEYRERLKLNPEAYKFYRMKENIRLSEYRGRQTKEQSDRNRNLQKIRQARYREKKREEAKAVKTRKTMEKEREKMRQAKRLQRACITKEKRDEINCKRRLQYAEKKTYIN